MKRALVIAVAAGAVVLVWAALYFPSASSTVPANGRPPVEADHPPSAGAVAPPSAVRPPAVPAAAPVPTAAPPPVMPERAPSGSTATADDPPPDLRPEKMGPIEELKAAYASDTRDHEAGALEERIRGHLKAVETPPEMLRGVSCVKSVCKLELRWTPADKEAYLIAMMNLVSHVSQKVAAEPVGEDDGQAVRPIDVYVSRIEPPYTPTGAN
jgi:hypothetical protein